VADPRIAAPIWRALGDARTVVNVGAGAGSYEPVDREVTAVEPSEVMIAQRSTGAAPVVQASAEQLPFADASFDAAMAVLTIHHWGDVARGLAEMTRVASRRVVIATFDPEVNNETWIIRDYLPELRVGRERWMPEEARVLAALPAARVEPIPVPRDCTDRMFVAHWGRPEAYLDPEERAATSVWHLLPPEVTARAIEALRADLESGVWDERYGDLRELPELDVGLRLITAEL
jgi:SAM-dependent methyltransferase